MKLYLERVNCVSVVYLGVGNSFKVNKPFPGWAIHNVDFSNRNPGSGYFLGTSTESHYFAPPDSDIVRLNTKIKPISRKLIL